MTYPSQKISPCHGWGKVWLSGKNETLGTRFRGSSKGWRRGLWLHSGTHRGALLLHRPSWLCSLVAGGQVRGTSQVVSYPMLNGSKLKTELGLIYSKEFRACCGAVDIFQLFMENNLEEVFSETVTLLKIIITTPMTTAEAERCFSTLKRVKTFLRNTMTQERLNALAMLSVENRLVCETTDFNQTVT